MEASHPISTQWIHLTMQMKTSKRFMRWSTRPALEARRILTERSPPLRKSDEDPVWWPLLPKKSIFNLTMLYHSSSQAERSSRQLNSILMLQSTWSRIQGRSNISRTMLKRSSISRKATLHTRSLSSIWLRLWTSRTHSEPILPWYCQDSKASKISSSS